MTDIDTDPFSDVIEDEHQRSYRLDGAVVFGFDGSHLVKTLMNQDHIWIEANGTVHVVAHMHPVYKLNVLLFLERNGEEVASSAGHGIGWLTQTKLYRRLKIEVMERLGVDCSDLVP